MRRRAIAAILASLLGGCAFFPGPAGAAGDEPGIILPPDFKATIFADHIGHARHIVVAPDGTVYANTWSEASYEDGKAPDGGFLVAMKDSQRTGHADMITRFGTREAAGGHGGTGIDLSQDALYAEIDDKIVRYSLKGDISSATPETVVFGLPLGGDHPMHPFMIDPRGDLFVDVASATNACQQQNRIPHAKGEQPCTEKQTRGGIWRFDAAKSNQVFSAAARFATGLRNSEGLSYDSAGRLYATQHGRDQLYENWPELYRPMQGHTQPAEELVALEHGADYGWPECYFDDIQKRLVLAPEYGGDGGKRVGPCAGRQAPLASFPAHWAPNDMKICEADAFPMAYKGGAFIAFHGSWNRAPAPQGGYNIVFQPMANGKAAGPFVVFADGFAGASKQPGEAAHRPTGLAIAPDGALYISDDVGGRIWRVTYSGDRAAPVREAGAARR